MTDRADLEYDLWRDLCARLKETGCVTAADLKAPVAECKTDGQKLLRAIRAWADDGRNDIARATINRACADEYVLTAIREWAQSARALRKE